MKNVINIGNDNNKTGKGYPLFLGENLGFADTVNVTYPEIEALYTEQRSQFWIETEHKMDQDKLDFKNGDPSVNEVMVLNLMSQWLMDSVAARSVMSLLEPFTTNNELVELLSAWSFYEAIHARTYSYIIRECFSDANEVLERAKKDIKVAYRSKIIGDVFNTTAKMSAQWTLGQITDEHEVRKQIYRTIVALYGLESISFMASFACTFAITDTGIFQGIANEVTQICKDELCHARFGKAVYEISVDKEGYGYVFEEIKDDVEAILLETVKQELSWAKYIFSDGRHALGINTVLLEEYVYFLAYPVFNKLNVQWPSDWPVITKNPLPHMDKYVTPDIIQSAAQEITLTNYRIGQVQNDVTDDTTFDF